MDNQRIAVIGSGVVGSSIAYHIARSGNQVTLFDRGFPMRATSGSTHAWVWVQSKRPDPYALLTDLSRELYPLLEREIGSFEFSPTGGLTPIFSENDIPAAHELIRQQRAVGIDVQWMSPSDVLEFEPDINPAVLGGVYSSRDANVNPLALVPALIRAGRSAGVTFAYGTRVESLSEAGAGWQLTLDNGGEWTGDQVVLAAGNWTPELLAPLGIRCPVGPVRGQILITQPVARIVRHTLSAVRQMTNGEILIGYSHEPDATTRDVSLPYLASAAQLAIQWFPALAGVPIIRSFAGLRVMPADGLPILGPIDGFPGLSIACMHSGYTLAPVLGQLAAEWVSGESPSVNLTPFSPTRFVA